MGVTCGICYEEHLQEVGELDSCCHRFCHPCIVKWAERENKCPFCKQRFIVIKRKRLQPDSGHDSDGSGPLKLLKGQVLSTTIVEDRRQTWEPEEILNINLEELRCEVCASGADDEHLLICDGCDAGYHTYCLQLQAVPEGEWFCPGCAVSRRGRQGAWQNTHRGSRGRRGSTAQEQIALLTEDEENEFNSDDCVTSDEEVEERGDLDTSAEEVDDTPHAELLSEDASLHPESMPNALGRQRSRGTRRRPHVRQQSAAAHTRRRTSSRRRSAAARPRRAARSTLPAPPQLYNNNTGIPPGPDDTARVAGSTPFTALQQHRRSTTLIAAHLQSSVPVNRRRTAAEVRRYQDEVNIGINRQRWEAIRQGQADFQQTMPDSNTGHDMSTARRSHTSSRSPVTAQEATTTLPVQGQRSSARARLEALVRQQRSAAAAAPMGASVQSSAPQPSHSPAVQEALVRTVHHLFSNSLLQEADDVAQCVRLTTDSPVSASQPISPANFYSRVTPSVSPPVPPSAIEASEHLCVPRPRPRATQVCRRPALDIFSLISGPRPSQSSLPTNTSTVPTTAVQPQPHRHQVHHTEPQARLAGNHQPPSLASEHQHVVLQPLAATSPTNPIVLQPPIPTTCKEDQPHPSKLDRGTASHPDRPGTFIPKLPPAASGKHPRSPSQQLLHTMPRPVPWREAVAGSPQPLPCDEPLPLLGENQPSTQEVSFPTLNIEASNAQLLHDFSAAAACTSNHQQQNSRHIYSSTKHNGRPADDELHHSSLGSRRHQSEQDNRQRRAQPSARRHTQDLKGRVPSVKDTAYEVVRAVLKPFYSSGKLTREQFKETARQATHLVYQDINSGRLSVADLQVSDSHAREAVKEVLQAAGLVI